MNPLRPYHTNEDPAADDLDAYIASFSEDERKALTEAEEAIDREMLLYRTRAFCESNQAEGVNAPAHGRSMRRQEKPRR